jgi:hypothetical protein
MLHKIRPKLTYSNVISTLCLFLLLGGGTVAIAASNTKAIKKVVQSLAPGLSVNHANSADSATNANHATSADHATNADSAANAGHATDADHAGNSDQLGGKNPSEYGAVLSGRINGLTSSPVQNAFPSGITTASGTASGSQMLSPNHDLTARDFSVQLTAAPGGGTVRDFFLIVNGSAPASSLRCGSISGTATTCNSGAATGAIPANSTLAIEETAGGFGSAAAADALFGLSLTP